jgi:C4-dicarboxylate transporter
MSDTLKEQMRLERYKLVTDRQKYFTELARDTFASYMKIFTGLAAGGIALISAKSKLELGPDILKPLLYTIAVLISFLGIVAIAQIAFCLKRWKGYRDREREVNPDSPSIKKWYWVFETLYCVSILLSIVAVFVFLQVWVGSDELMSVIAPGK